MICRKCGYENSDENTFCLRCGSSISQSEAVEKKFCPKCGNENKAEAAFCVKCGASMAQKNSIVRNNSTAQRNLAEVYQQILVENYENNNNYDEGYSSLSAGINPWILRGLFVMPILTLFLVLFDRIIFTVSGFELMFDDNDAIDKLKFMFDLGNSGAEVCRVFIIIISVIMVVGVCYPNIVTPIISFLGYFLPMILLLAGLGTDALQQVFGIGFYLGLLANLVMIAVMCVDIYLKKQNEYARNRNW